MLYQLEVRLLKTVRGNCYWRPWRPRRGDDVGSYARLPDDVPRFTPASRSPTSAACGG